MGAILAILGGLMGLTLSFTIQPKYVVEMTLMPTTEDSANSIAGMLQSSLGAFGSLAGLSSSNQALTTEALATIQSRQFLQAFISRNIPLTRLYPRLVDESGSWTVSESEVPSVERAYTHFRERVFSISHDRQSGLVTVRMRWPDPNEAADWLNLMVIELNNEMRERELARSNGMVEALRSKLDETKSVALHTSLARLLEVYLNKAAIAESREDFALQVLDPASSPDPSEYSSPNRVIYFLMGAMIALLGLIGVKQTSLGPRIDAAVGG